MNRAKQQQGRQKVVGFVQLLDIQHVTRSNSDPRANGHFRVRETASDDVWKRIYC
jgi:hypothetical protein